MKADEVTEKEIISVINKFAEFYSNRDLEGLMSLIAPGSDIVVIGVGIDDKLLGFNETKMQFERIWSQFEAASIDFNCITISVSGSVAWTAVDTLYKVKVEGHNLIFSCYVTIILEKREEKWFFVHTHHSVPVAKLPHHDVKQHLSQL